MTAGRVSTAGFLLTMGLGFLTVDVVAGQTASAPPSAFGLSRTELVFGLGPAGNDLVVTPPQRVFLELRGDQPLAWTAAADRPWLDVQPASGKLPARLTISVRPSALAGDRRDDEGHVVVTVDNGGTVSQAAIRVALRVVPERHPPIGSLDAPADRAIVEGRTRLFGWALHDIGLSRIAICRDRIPRAPSDDACGAGLTYLGEAAIYYFARPDVAAAMQAMPLHDRSGWTYGLDADALPKGGGGTFRIHAVATAIDGSRSVIGTRTITVLPEPAAATLSPRVRTIITILLVGLAVHVLLGWLCLPRLSAATPVSTTAGAPASWLEVLGIASLVTLSLAMSVPAMRTSLTYDELYLASVYAVGVPVWTAALKANTFIHIAYALAAAVTVRIVGASEFALRLPAAVLGAASVYALWRYTRSLIGPRTALVSALVLALLPFHAHWSRMAKGYTGLSFATLLALHGFRTVIRDRSGRHAVEHATGLVLGMYFHLYAVWVFLVQYAAFAVLSVGAAVRKDARSPLTRRSGQLLWWSFLGAAAVTVGLYAPVAHGLLQALAYFGEQVSVPRGLVQDIFTEFSGSGWIVSRVAIAALLALGAANLWRRSRLDALQLFAMIVIPVAVVMWIVRPMASGARYFGYWVPVFALLIAGGLSLVAAWPSSGGRSWWRRIPGPAIAVCLLVLLAADWVRQDATAGPRDGYGERLAMLNDLPRAPVAAIGADSEMFQYYVHQPMSVFVSADQLEQALLNQPLLRVAYHDVTWNSPEQQRMGALLQRRCPVTDHGVVRIYVCGG
jgi:hypothetical protein